MEIKNLFFPPKFPICSPTSAVSIIKEFYRREKLLPQTIKITSLFIKNLTLTGSYGTTTSSILDGDAGQTLSVILVHEVKCITRKFRDEYIFHKK